MGLEIGTPNTVGEFNSNELIDYGTKATCVNLVCYSFSCGGPAPATPLVCIKILDF